MKIINVVNTLVFLFASTLVISIFYEGLMLEWYNIVPVLILITDVNFVIATILNIIINRKKRIIFMFNLFSIIIICVATIMKIFNIAYPQWSLLLWHFYILYFYGTQTVLCIYKYTQSKINVKL
jgi:hypothetical protein